MKPVRKVDAKGFYVEDVMVDDEYMGINPDGDFFLVDTIMPSGLYKAKFDFEKKVWVEDMSPEEIDAIENPKNPTKTIEQQVVELTTRTTSGEEANAMILELIEILSSKGVI